MLVVAAGNPWSDPAERFVGDGVRPAREFVKADALANGDAKQRHDGPGMGVRNVGEVDDALIHRDSADKRHPPTSNDGFASARVGPRHAVGVAEWNESDPQRSIGAIRSPIADRCASGKRKDP